MSDFAEIDPLDDYLQTVGAQSAYSLVETYFFAFHVPELELNAFLYASLRPTLRVASAGALIYRGFNRYVIDGDFCDYQQYLPYPVGNAGDLTFANGLRIEILEPRRRFRVSYADAARGTHFVVEFDAVSPTIARPTVMEAERPVELAGVRTGGLEQLMHATGELVLAGAHHRIDCYTVRDRSFGQNRTEADRKAPPAGWCTAAFGPDLAFNAVGTEDPATAPWRDSYPKPEGAASHLFAWIHRDGQTHRLTRFTRTTERDPDTLQPLRHHIELEDTTGYTCTATGRVVSNVPFPFWPNMATHVGLLRWTLDDGRIGWGDNQEAFYQDYSRRYATPLPTPGPESSARAPGS